MMKGYEFMAIRRMALNPNLTVRSIGTLALAPAFFLSSSAFAAVIVDNGAQLDIDASTTPIIDYLVRNGSLLTVNGATTQSITLQTGSTLNINGATVNGNAGEDGIIINASQANINQARVTSDAIALLVNREPGSTQGSKVTVAGGHFFGVDAGAAATAFSTLDLTGAEVTGTGTGSVGLIVNGGAVRAMAGTRISGDVAGVLMDRDPDIAGANSLVLDNAGVEGRSGPAILVEQGINASIEVKNNSTLQAGDGTLLQVRGASTAAMRVTNNALRGNVQVNGNSTANLTFDQGQMTGDVLVEQGSTANVTLQNQSRFTGRLDNATGVTLSQSDWIMTGSDTVGSLTLDSGRVDFGNQPGTFRQLNVGTLDGTGTFAMKGDFATGGGDFLNVTGAANGQFGLEVATSGRDAASPQQLALVRTAAGDAQFSLVGGRVDLGTWSYDLASNADATGGTDWFLDPTTKTVSPGAQSVLALFNTAPTISYGELKSLESRMGALQSDGNLHGVWVRPYGNKYNVAEGSGVGYRQLQQGISVGADTRLGDSQWRVGVLAGTSHSDLDLQGGTSADVESYYIGPYFSWQNPDNGYYVDGALKFNHFRNDSSVRLSDGTKAKGDYNNSGVSVWVEGGRHIKLDNDWFAKPFAQLSAAVFEGADYRLDNGMEADGDRTRSLRSKLGISSGRDFRVSRDTVVQPYGHVAMVHEFANDDDVRVNGNTLNTDLSGSGFEVGAGVAVSLSQNMRLDAGVDYGKGEHVEQPWAYKVGVSYQW